MAYLWNDSKINAGDAGMTGAASSAPGGAFGQTPARLSPQYRRNPGVQRQFNAPRKPMDMTKGLRGTQPFASGATPTVGGGSPMLGAPMTMTVPGGVAPAGGGETVGPGAPSAAPQINARPPEMYGRPISVANAGPVTDGPSAADTNQQSAILRQLGRPATSTGSLYDDFLKRQGGGYNPPSAPLSGMAPTEVPTGNPQADPSLYQPFNSGGGQWGRQRTPPQERGGFGGLWRQPQMGGGAGYNPAPSTGNVHLRVGGTEQPLQGSTGGYQQPPQGGAGSYGGGLDSLIGRLNAGRGTAGAGK